MKLFVGIVVDRGQRLVARSRWLSWLAAKLRNQCNRVIAYSVCESPRAELNGEVWLLQKLGGKIETVFDVGANEGEWTQLALRSLETIRKAVLFEPNAVLAESLRRRFANIPPVEVVQSAVGSSRGTVDFHEFVQSSEAGSLWRSGNERPVKTYSVPATTIEIECSRLGLHRLDLLKVDTEGNDFHVLEGAQSLLQEQAIGVVQFEYGASWIPAGSTLRRATDYLGSFGYEVFALKPNCLEKISVASTGEYFGYSNFIAISEKFLSVFGLGPKA